MPKTQHRRSLLQYDLIAFFQPAQYFGLRAVRDSDVDGHFIFAVFTLRVGNLHGCLLVFVVDDRAFRNLQNVLVFFQDNFRVGSHLGFQLAARVLDRDAYFERCDVILLHAHRRNLRHLAFEGFVFERLHLDAGALSQIHLADIALVDLALYVDFAGIAQRHDECGGRSQHEDRTHRVAHLDVAREHDAIDRRNDVGIAELFFELSEIGLIFYYLRLGLCDLRLQHGDLRLRDILLVQRHLVILLGVVEGGSGNNAVLGHADRAVVCALENGYIRTFRVDLGALEVGLRTLQIRLGSFKCGPRLRDLCFNFNLVELGQELSFLDVISVVHQELLDDAAGLRFHFDLCNGRDLASRDHALGQVPFFHFGEFRGINLGTAARRRENSTCNQQHDDAHHTAPND